MQITAPNLILAAQALSKKFRCTAGETGVRGDLRHQVESRIEHYF
jgi:hypothetical protein